MKFHLIRHGRTDWNDLNHIQGKSDIPLNENGIIQAKKLSEQILADRIPIVHIYTSPLIRAVQTADILSSSLGIPYHVHAGLREVDLGNWEGLTWEEVADRFPDDYNKWHVNRRYVTATGGESYNDMLLRTLDALKEIASVVSEDTAIITHSAVIMALLCYLNNEPFEKMKKFKAANATIITIDSNLLFVEKFV
ncbi:MAG: histidine phosphatase family protein [Lachnospiraceae bacterium]|nr:histidine phosphatase family protein [Lachnospiraceae bacterium]